METSKNYYESMMRDFGMYARGRSLEQYCRDEAVDFKWLTKAMEQYGVPEEDKKPRQKRRAAVRTADKAPEMIRLHYDAEAEIADTPATSCGTAIDAYTPMDDGDTLSNVREILGPDFSDMPPGFKVITRKGSPDSMVTDNQDKRIEPMVHLIARLFAAERIISEMKNLTETQRLRERQRMCRPLVDAMISFMRKVKDAGTEYSVLARRAADYLLDDVEGFSAFLNCGLLEIENNAVEHCFRNIAMGHGTWLFTGSHKGAENLVFMYSLEESCRMNGLDFGTYIEYVLERMVAGDRDARSLLPNRDNIPADRVPESQIDCPGQEKIA